MADDREGLGALTPNSATNKKEPQGSPRGDVAPAPHHPTPTDPQAPVRAESDTLIAEAEALVETKTYEASVFVIADGNSYYAGPDFNADGTERREGWWTSRLPNAAMHSARHQAEHAAALLNDPTRDPRVCEVLVSRDPDLIRRARTLIPQLTAHLRAAEQAVKEAEAEWTAKYLQCHELLKHNTEALGAARRQLQRVGSGDTGPAGLTPRAAPTSTVPPNAQAEEHNG